MMLHLVSNERMIDQLKLVIQGLESGETHVKLSMEFDPMQIEAATIDTPIKPTLHKVKLTIETERYM